MTLVLSALSKTGKYVEVFYDLHAGLAKLAVVDSLPSEIDGGEALPEEAGPMSVTIDTGKGGEADRSLEIPAGRHLAMAAGAETRDFLEALALLRAPSSGHIALDGIDARSLDRPAAREQVILVGPAETFSGTVAENLRAGRDGISASELRAALESVGLADRVARLPLGMATPLAPDGHPLEEGEADRKSTRLNSSHSSVSRMPSSA